MDTRFARTFGLLIVAVLFAGSVACGKKEPTRWDNAQQKADEAKAADAPKPVVAEGGNLNKFFPQASGEFERVAAQEKDGFAEYRLKRNGKEVAMLAINDTRGNPSAAEKFKTSKEKVGGYPAMHLGATQSAVLVGDRYQVKVLSRDPSFTKDDRLAWIQKFDLKGLEALR